jgi:hypothetical protein
VHCFVFPYFVLKYFFVLGLRTILVVAILVIDVITVMVGQGWRLIVIIFLGHSWDLVVNFLGIILSHSWDLVISNGICLTHSCGLIFHTPHSSGFSGHTTIGAIA